LTRRGCNKLTQEVGERRVVTFVELDIAKTVCQSDGLEISLNNKQTITDTTPAYWQVYRIFFIVTVYNKTLLQS